MRNYPAFILQFLLSIRDHLLAWLQAAFDDNVSPLGSVDDDIHDAHWIVRLRSAATSTSASAGTLAGCCGRACPCAATRAATRTCSTACRRVAYSAPALTVRAGVTTTGAACWC